jgi:hypothetical protein
MNVRPYLLISGVVFLLVALLHLVRVLNGWELQWGPWRVPMWISWGGAVGPGVLGVWSFRLAARVP